MSYDGQYRGARGAYERYLKGMDASMRQKVALTAAHLPSEGRVADMGMGSGTGTEALAALYPEMDVVGVDVSTTMVDRASPSTSSAIMANERFPAWSIFSMIPTISLGELIFWSVMRNDGLSRATSIRSVSVTKWGER